MSFEFIVKSVDSGNFGTKNAIAHIIIFYGPEVKDSAIGVRGRTFGRRLDEISVLSLGEVELQT